MIKKKNDTFKKYLTPFVFFLIIFIFHLIFTRLLIKTDDGHFSGIVNAPDFTYSSWLTERYNTVSGRTIGEFLLAFFLRNNLILWKIANSLMMTYPAYFWCRLSESFKGGFTADEKQIYCCCGIFTMFVSCLNPAALWYAGSFSYLWPFCGILMTVAPLVFYILNGKINISSIVISFFASFIGTMQEQSAACCIAIYLILLTTILIRKMEFRLSMVLPLIPMAVCAFSMFNSPGAKGRIAMETSASFARFGDFGIFEKFLCGLSTFFSNSYYFSNFLIIVFTALLSVAIYSCVTGKSKTKAKRLLIIANAVVITICVPMNYGIAIFKKSFSHIIFRNCLTKGEFDFSFYLLFALGCLVTVILFTMTCVLIKQNRKLGLIIGVLLAAGFFSAIAMGFSPTVFSSGQRTGFYTNMFVITACVVLFSSAEKTKVTTTLYKATVVYSILTFSLNCFAFKLIEHPFMG